MHEVAGDPGAWLQLLEEGGQRSALIALVLEADRSQMARESLREELATRLRSNFSTGGDGMNRGFDGLPTPR